MLLSDIHELKQLEDEFPLKKVAGMTYWDFCNYLYGKVFSQKMADQDNLAVFVPHENLPSKLK
jgi:hypothetical protein